MGAPSRAMSQVDQRLHVSPFRTHAAAFEKRWYNCPEFIHGEVSMQTLDLRCPSCGAILKTKTDLDHIEPGIHHVTCEYCDYQGLLKIDDDAHVALEDVEQQSYAKARGALRAKSEYEQDQSTKLLKIIFFIIFIIAALVIIFSAVNVLRRPTIDPFEFAFPEFSGINGQGKADIVLIQPDDSDVSLNDIEYELSKTHELQEGEEVVLAADSDTYDLTEHEMKFVVHGLSKQLDDVTRLSADARQTIHDISVSALKSSYDRLAELTESIEYEPAGMYLISDGKQQNRLHDVFRMKITLEDDSVATYYGSVNYTNIVVFDGEAATVAYDSKWSLNGPIQQVRSDTAVAGYAYIFSSLEDAKAEVKEGMQGNYSEFEE